MKLLTSLSSKLSFFTALIIICVSTLIASIVFFSAKQSLIEHTINNLQSDANLIASDIENALISIVNDLLVVSKTPPISGIIRSAENNGQDPREDSTMTLWRERLATIFTAMLKVNKNYTQIRYIGLANNGKEIVRVDRTGDDVYAVDESTLQEKANEPYFKEAIQLAQGSIMFSKVNYNKEHGKVQLPLIPTLRVIMPIYDEKQKLFGILAINVNYEAYLRDNLNRINQNYNIYLYNEHDDLFFYDSAYRTLKFFPRDATLQSQTIPLEHIDSTKEWIESIVSTDNTIIITAPIYSDFNKNNKVLNMALEAKKSDLFKDDNQVINTIILWIAFISVVATILVYIFSTQLLKHLRNMALSIEQSTSHHKNAMYLPTTLNDEVGVLARAFVKKTKLLNTLALYDSLTRLPNRKNFIEHLEENILHAKRMGRNLAILFIDLNDFKQINDTYGHSYGDELLIKFSSNLKNTTREDELCARLGGDEFVVILQDIEFKQNMDVEKTRFKNSLEKVYEIKGISFYLSLSIGHAIYPEDGTTVEELIRKADAAMYTDKLSQKNNKLV